MSFRNRQFASSRVGSTISKSCASRKGEETPFSAARVPHLTCPHFCCRAVVAQPVPMR